MIGWPSGLKKSVPGRKYAYVRCLSKILIRNFSLQISTDWVTLQELGRDSLVATVARQRAGWSNNKGWISATVWNVSFQIF